MDAVELPLPADITVSKLMGSEAFGVVGVTSDQVEAREVGRLSTLASSSIDRDEAVNASRLNWNKLSNVEHDSQLASFQCEDSSKGFNALLLAPIREDKHLAKKSVKVARSNNGSLKRSRTSQSEVSVNETHDGDINGKLKELGSCDAKSNIAEKSQLIKQKSNSNGKRGDKRNGKLPKSKSDSFCLKAGLVSFSSAAGGNNILGLYGLKPDINDVTKQLEEPLLNELLDGSYMCPSIPIEKENKAAANLSENIMSSFREACSILRLQKHTQPQDLENNCDSKIHITADSSVAVNKNDCDKADTHGAGLLSPNKDSCIKLKATSNNITRYTLHRPKDILGRLALPTPKHLDILLMDLKPVSASKSNPDPRLGKPVSHRCGLQPFSWSQSSGGHCRSNSDSNKLSTSRHTCLGRWVKIGNPASYVEPTTGFIADFESLTYDHRLVPLQTQKREPKEFENVSSSSFINPPSFATCSIASSCPPDEQCTKLLAAAQTLLDIAIHSLKQSPLEMRRWPKKPSQKSMRACNYKPNEKPEEVFAVPKPKTKPNGLVNGAYETPIPSKKLKLSANQKHIQTADNLTKGPINWCADHSNRSAGSKFIRHHNNKNSTGELKKSYMMPPPAMVLDRASNNQQPKVRKLGPMDWNRTGGKRD